MRAQTTKLACFGAAAILMLPTGAIWAQEQEGGHESGGERHRFAIAGFIGTTRVDSENELTLGFEGGFNLGSKWSVGAVVERADREKHSTLVLVGVGWHPIGHALRIQLGVGRKNPSGSTENVARMGLAYEIEIKHSWFVKPYMAVDFIDGEDDEGVFGLYIGRGF